jgi:hypothetical protein
MGRLVDGPVNEAIALQRPLGKIKATTEKSVMFYTDPKREIPAGAHVAVKSKCVRRKPRQRLPADLAMLRTP